MIEFFRRLFEADSLAPHGICLLWRPELIWTHVVSDAIIGLAYFSIPLALAYFVSKRRDVAFGWLFWCFAVFILACGTGHFIDIWTLWSPQYGIEAVVKAVTAAASIATAIVLWPLLPKALALPSPAALRHANAELSAALEALHRETAERQKAEEMLRQAQKMEAVGQLTGGIAHDFNNLLTVIVANLERIERRAPADAAELRQAIDNALEGADRAAALTQQLLAFARKQPLQPVSVEPVRLVGTLSLLLRRTIGETVALDIRIPEEVGPLQVDRNQLENALLNLAINARDAMPEGGTLTIAARNVGRAEAAALRDLGWAQFLEISVRDTGTGMPPEVADRVFEPFFTTKPLGEGTGLGLSQVYGFVKQSGGHVVLDTAPGQGTAVRLYLPRAVPQERSESAMVPALA